MYALEKEALEDEINKLKEDQDILNNEINNMRDINDKVIKGNRKV